MKQKIDPRELLEFAKLSAITYDNPNRSAEKFKELGYDVIKFFDVRGAQGYLLTDGTKHALSFRGTEIKQKSDILADLKAGKNHEGLRGKVHVGFKHETDKLWPEVIDIVSKTPGTLYITGHSLGAAIATIMASRLQFKTEKLITFGSPRVGDSVFVENLEVDHLRVQNNNDAVTRVPLEKMHFAHHGQLVYLNYYGEIRELTNWQRIKDVIRSRLRAYSKFQLFRAVYDHLMKNYISKLEKLVRSKTGA